MTEKKKIKKLARFYFNIALSITFYCIGYICALIILDTLNDFQYSKNINHGWFAFTILKLIVLILSIILFSKISENYSRLLIKYKNNIIVNRNKYHFFKAMKFLLEGDDCTDIINAEDIYNTKIIKLQPYKDFLYYAILFIKLKSKEDVLSYQSKQYINKMMFSAMPDNGVKFIF